MLQLLLQTLFNRFLHSIQLLTKYVRMIFYLDINRWGKGQKHTREKSVHWIHPQMIPPLLINFASSNITSVRY
jgi:hypothetical protein